MFIVYAKNIITAHIFINIGIFNTKKIIANQNKSNHIAHAKDPLPSLK